MQRRRFGSSTGPKPMTLDFCAVWGLNPTFPLASLLCVCPLQPLDKKNQQASPERKEGEMGDDAEETSRRIQVRFVTKLNDPLKVPPTSIAIPANLTRFGLSTIVNKLLQGPGISPFLFHTHQYVSAGCMSFKLEESIAITVYCSGVILWLLGKLTFALFFRVEKCSLYVSIVVCILLLHILSSCPSPPSFVLRNNPVI